MAEASERNHVLIFSRKCLLLHNWINQKEPREELKRFVDSLDSQRTFQLWYTSHRLLNDEEQEALPKRFFFYLTMCWFWENKG